jgi:hypothetical protein
MPWSGAPDCPVYQGTQLQTRHLRENQRALHYNSPNCPVCQWSNGYYSANGNLQRIQCTTVRARVRAAPEGTPDSLQEMSGAPPYSQKTPPVRAQTVEP